MAYRLRSTAVWFGIWALLLPLLLPLARPVAAAPYAGLDEAPIICTAHGLQQGEPDNSAPGMNLRCPDCQGLVHLGFIPQPPQTPIVSTSFLRVVFTLSARIPPAANVFFLAQARAPPAIA